MIWGTKKKKADVESQCLGDDYGGGNLLECHDNDKE